MPTSQTKNSSKRSEHEHSRRGAGLADPVCNDRQLLLPRRVLIDVSIPRHLRYQLAELCLLTYASHEYFARTDLHLSAAEHPLSQLAMWCWALPSPWRLALRKEVPQVLDFTLKALMQEIIHHTFIRVMGCMSLVHAPQLDLTVVSNGNHQGQQELDCVQQASGTCAPH
jgi:hypothetical protein